MAVVNAVTGKSAMGHNRPFGMSGSSGCGSGIIRGAGAEMRQSLGTAVFFGMLGVTFFGLVFTPVFYVACRRPALLRRPRGEPGARAPEPAAE